MIRQEAISTLRRKGLHIADEHARNVRVINDQEVPFMVIRQSVTRNSLSGMDMQRKVEFNYGVPDTICLDSWNFSSTDVELSMEGTWSSALGLLIPRYCGVIELKDSASSPLSVRAKTIIGSTIISGDFVKFMLTDPYDMAFCGESIPQLTEALAAHSGPEQGQVDDASDRQAASFILTATRLAMAQPVAASSLTPAT